MTSTAPALVPDPLASVSVRDQIIEAADEYFSRFGYAKTTVSDLAKAIGFSKAYIYKFFDSKQAIGEAICTRSLTGQLLAVEAAVEAADGPNERLRAFFREILKQSLEQFFNDRQLYDIVSHSCAEQWGSSRHYAKMLLARLTTLVQEGRDAGAFEKKTPIDDVCCGIWFATSPFTNPVMLQLDLDGAPAGLEVVLGLVLRSLAP
jgi:AcrR family transcriptional regulator